MPTRGTSSPGSEPSWPASSTGKNGAGSSAPWAGASTAASGALVESFGGVVSDPVPPPPPPVRTAVSARTTRQPAAPAGGPPPSVGDILRSLPPHVCTRMEGLARRCQGDLDFLAPLYKASFAALAQVPRAAERDLQTVLCADASGSMFDLYRGGRVQQMFDKFFALSFQPCQTAVALDCWAFAAKSRQLEPVTLDNIRGLHLTLEAGGYERWIEHAQLPVQQRAGG